MPIISLSVIVALSNYKSDGTMSKIWKKALVYTICTTIAAASVSAILYTIISPSSFETMKLGASAHPRTDSAKGYIQYFLDVIPDSIFGSFAEHKVLSVLLLSVILGCSVRAIENENSRNIVISFFNGLHNMFFAITKIIVRILPIGLFGFITVGISEIQVGSIGSMGRYFMVIVLSNLIQGIVILPIWLLAKGIDPLKTFRAMSPALSVAFFSKSSSGALPVTIETAEAKLGVSKRVSRFVFPLCTTINMNGCAAFIFTTVIYVMQNYGIEITPLTMITWILIATLAAIGNAGVPMGCFFLSTSLLSSMDVPVPLLGIILPFYGLVDMIETALNVWSDSCVVKVVDKMIPEE
jgi:Na+/H+-dicarboxylate symporter